MQELTMGNSLVKMLVFSGQTEFSSEFTVQGRIVVLSENLTIIEKIL